MISYILSFAFIVLVLQSIPVQCSIGRGFCRERFLVPARETRVQKRCFAASAWTGQANKFSLLNAQRYIVQRLNKEFFSKKYKKRQKSFCCGFQTAMLHWI